jgi:macrodomain Ter protein organizer (MatP/YcbG family)
MKQRVDAKIRYLADTKNKRPMTVRLNSKVCKKLTEQAERENMSLSKYLAVLITDYILAEEENMKEKTCVVHQNEAE